MPNKPIYLDNTLLKRIAGCSTAGLLSAHHGLTVEGTGVAAYCGQVVHEVLALHLQGERLERCLAHFDETYESFSAENILEPEGKMERLTHYNVRKIVESWLTWNQPAEWPFLVYGAETLEHTIRAPLLPGGEVMLVGTVDAFVQDRLTGSLHILDHKTKGQVMEPWVESLKMSSQFMGYIWLAKQALGLDIKSVYVNVIHLSKVPGSNRKCYTHGVAYEECGPLHPAHRMIGPLSYSEEMIDAWFQSAQRLARKFKAMASMYPTLQHLINVPAEGFFKETACEWCPFDKFCRAGRPAELVPSLFVKDPWVAELGSK